MKRINIWKDRVLHQGEAHQIIHLPAIQPAGDNSFYAMLAKERMAPALPGIRQCVLLDGQWHDQGQIEYEDASWHPDLPTNLGEYVAIARQVIQAIPGAHSITTMLEYIRLSGSDEFRSSILVMKCDEDDPTQSFGCMDEQTLDRTPMVRYLERSGTLFQDFLKIEGYMDASGFEGEFSLNVSPTSMDLFHEGPEGDYLRLISQFEDGKWVHKSEIWQVEYEAPDAITELRNHKDVAAYGAGVFAETHWSKIYDGNPVATSFRTQPGDRNSHRVISYIAGTLYRADTEIKAAA